MDWITQIFGAFVGLGAAGMALVGAAAVATLVFAFLEKGWQALLAMAAVFAGAAYFGGATPLGVLWAHPLLSAGAFVAYFVAGSFWSVAKFRLYTGGLKAQFREFKERWLDQRGAKSVEELDPAALAEFRSEAQLHMASRASHGSYPVLPQQHKATILFWMGWWPVSVVAYLLDEPIKRLMEALYRMFSGVYAKIAREQGREYLADMGR